MLRRDAATDVAPRCGYRYDRRDAATDFALRWAGSNITDSPDVAGTNTKDKSIDHVLFNSCYALQSVDQDAKNLGLQPGGKRAKAL